MKELKVAYEGEKSTPEKIQWSKNVHFLAHKIVKSIQTKEGNKTDRENIHSSD